MKPINKNILIMIPCYNEEKRLDLEQFLVFFRSQKNQNIFFLFSDDGSQDQTKEKINSFISKNSLSSFWFYFENKKNLGKAAALYNAYHGAVINSPVKFDWIGFFDADLATPLTEINKMLQYGQVFYPEKSAIFGSRVLKLGSDITRNPLRHYLGRIFATLLFLALRPKCYDSQCGAKIFARSAADRAFSEPFISSLIFDVEMILRIGEDNIVEYPVTKWADQPGSKIRISRVWLQVLKDLYLIRQKYRRA